LNMVLVENITRSCENNAFSLPKWPLNMVFVIENITWSCENNAFSLPNWPYHWRIDAQCR
jgi:hypothetical protein